MITCLMRKNLSYIRGKVVAMGGKCKWGLEGPYDEIVNSYMMYRFTKKKYHPSPTFQASKAGTLVRVF